MNNKTIAFLLIGILFLTACVPGAAGGSTPTSVLPSPIPTDTPAPTQVVPAPTETHIPVDLTPAQLAAVQAVSKKYNLPVDQIQLVSTEAMTWENGCLGVVLPGVMCIKGPIEGFKMILEANGRQFEIHTNQDGTNVIDAAQQLATLRFVVFTPPSGIEIVNPSIPLGPTYDPAFNGFFNRGDTIAGTSYVYVSTDRSMIVAVNDSGKQELSFIHNPTYSLAVWRGGLGTQPRLAWGTQWTADTPSSLQISAPDGSGLETLLTADPQANPRYQMVAQLWSADGESLYFSKEPVGIGGYILFGGASSLYKIDLATKQVTELIPFLPSSGVMTCLDAISGDYRFIADHCLPGVLTVRDLTTGETVTIQPPQGLTDFKVLGSARFSPDGKLLAFALGKNNPDSEQGWLAIADSSGGVAKLISTGVVGSYYNVVGWLDDQTILVQDYPLGCANCPNQLMTIQIDGTGRQTVANGSFLTVIDNR